MLRPSWHNLAYEGAVPTLENRQKAISLGTTAAAHLA
jgi:hypothetical protein